MGIQDGLIAHYTMDNISGNTLIDETGSYDGIITGTNQVEGINGLALSFDGDDDCVKLGQIPLDDELQLLGDFSISLWVKSTGGGDEYQRIFDKSDGAGVTNGFAIYLYIAASSIVFNINGTSYVTSFNFNGEFAHYFYTCKNNTLKVFKDNTLVTSWTADPRINAVTDASIGTWNHSSGRELNGSLDDFRIYNREITEQERQIIYTNVDELFFNFHQNTPSFFDFNSADIPANSVTLDFYQHSPQFFEFTATELPIDNAVLGLFENTPQFFDMQLIEMDIVDFDLYQHGPAFYDFDLLIDLPFEATIYHTKLYGIALGDFDLSHAVTAVSATINATQKSLNVTLAGAELIDEINARANDNLRFYVYYLNHKTQQIDDSVDLITVPFIDIDPRLGGRSSSLALSGQSLPDEHTGTTITVGDVEYLTATQLRIPVNFNIKPGDTVTHAYGQMLADSVTYSLSNNNQFMTITAA